MSIRNENKEILGEIYKALDHIDESRQLFTSLERTLRYMEEVLENTKETKYYNICGLFECEGDVVDKDYLIYDLVDDFYEVYQKINKIFEIMPFFEEESKLVRCICKEEDSK